MQEYQLCRQHYDCLALCQVDSCDMCGDRDVPVCPAITRMGVPVSQSVTKILQLPAPPLMRTEDRVDVSCMNIRSLTVPSWKISSVSQPKQTSAQCHNIHKHQLSVTIYIDISSASQHTQALAQCHNIHKHQLSVTT